LSRNAHGGQRKGLWDQKKNVNAVDLLKHLSVGAGPLRSNTLREKLETRTSVYPQKEIMGFTGFEERKSSLREGNPRIRIWSVPQGGRHEEGRELRFLYMPERRGEGGKLLMK